jgi:pimeloyl-ACP methyl ester carboxylesterase
VACAKAQEAAAAARNVREYLGMKGPLMHHDTGSKGSEAGMAAKKRLAATAPVHLRRMYLDIRYGQLHLTTAYPASGGFDEATPVIFLHADDGNGADFNHCAVPLAVVDLVGQLRLRRFDLVGVGRGALVAYELATTRAQEVRRLVNAGGPEPQVPIAQPMIRLSSDPACLLEEPAEAMAGQIRAFLDRA